MDILDNSETPKNEKEERFGSLFIVTAFSILIGAVVFAGIRWGYPRIDKSFKLEPFSKKFYLIHILSYCVIVVFTSITLFMNSKTAKFVDSILILPLFVILTTIVVGVFAAAAYFVVTLFISGANMFISLAVLGVVGYMIFKIMID